MEDLLSKATAAGIVNQENYAAPSAKVPSFSGVLPPSVAVPRGGLDVDAPPVEPPPPRAAVETPPLESVSAPPAAPAAPAVEPRRENLRKAVPLPSAAEVRAAPHADPGPGGEAVGRRPSAGAAAPPMPVSSGRLTSAASSSSRVPPGRDLPTERKFEDFLRLLEELERLLVEPRDLAAVGRTYRDLKEWTRLHQCDGDLAQVLDMLHGRFPAWRRQALEEAYRLFFDDVAKERAVTRDLPEPPTSEESGFRRLPDDLFSADVADGKAPFRGVFEDKSPCNMYVRRYEYQIQAVKCKGATWPGRKIVDKAHEEKVLPCAGDLVGLALRRMVELVAPIDQCCARRNEAPKACGPFFLPSDGRAPVRLPPEARPQLPAPRPAREPRALGGLGA